MTIKALGLEPLELWDKLILIELFKFPDITPLVCFIPTLSDHGHRCELTRYVAPESCNFALLSYAGGIGEHTFIGGTSWAKVNAGGNFMMTKCLLNIGEPSGGVVVVPSSKITEPLRPKYIMKLTNVFGQQCSPGRR